MTTQSVRQAGPSLQTTPIAPPQAAQPPLQTGATLGQGYGGHLHANDPAAPWSNLPAEMQRLNQWCVAGSDKSPRQTDGRRASVREPSTWTSLPIALAAAEKIGGGVGFVLTESDPFTCIDLDVKNAASHPDEPEKWTSQEDLDRHQSIINVADSYTERSRSGHGFHVWVKGNIGKGRRKRGGVEVYSQERFIICTGAAHRALPVADRQQMLSSMVSLMPSDASPVADLRPDQPDDDLGVCIAAFAMEDQDELGRLMRGDWQGRNYPSQSEADFVLMKMLAQATDSNGACREAFRLSILSKRTDKPGKYTDSHLNRTLQKVRVSLADEAAHLAIGQSISDALFWSFEPFDDQRIAESLISSSGITLEFAKSSDTATIRLEYLLDPFLPKKCVVGFYGRGSTSKSSFVATMAASVSRSAGSLWVSVEEPDDWIKVRHIASGGGDKTLLVVTAVPTKHDPQGRVSGSSFNIYEHLEFAVVQAQATFSEAGGPPLGLVVLDTAVGLTGWAKGETPNDDASVKRLLAYLQALAVQYNVTVALIGHANKGNYDHIADTVMGATAWTNSPRLSFVHAADRREDYAYVMRVAKTNLVTFGVPYRTVPVHTLYQRQDGPDSVLVSVKPGNIVWGDMDSMEMFKDATKKPKDDDETGDSGGFQQRAPTLVEQVIEHLAAMVEQLAPGEHVTREAVERHVGKPIDRSRWTKVDLSLQLHPIITFERGPKNAVLYSRRTQT